MKGPCINDEQWHHIALTASSDWQCMFVDGQVVCSINFGIGHELHRCDINNLFHLTWKYARYYISKHISNFVLGDNLFPDAHSFPPAMFSESCLSADIICLQKTVGFEEQINLRTNI